MSTTSDSPFVTLKVDPSTRQAASRLAYAMTGAASQRISQDKAIRIACAVALNHIDESVSAIGSSDDIQ